MTIANAFAAAGGEGNVSRSRIQRCWRPWPRKGSVPTRQDLTIDVAADFWQAPPTTGYSLDPVNTSTGNFLETEVDLGFAGCRSVAGRHPAPTTPWMSASGSSGRAGPRSSKPAWTRRRGRLAGAARRAPPVRFPRLGAGWDRADGESFWLGRETLDEAVDRTDNLRALTPAEVLVARDNAGARWVFTPAGTWLSQDTGPGTALSVRRDADGPHRRAGPRTRPPGAHRIRRGSGSWCLLPRTDAAWSSSTTSAGSCFPPPGRAACAATAGTTAGLIEAVTDAAGVEEAVNTYDEHRRVHTQVSAFGRVTRFAYLPGPPDGCFRCGRDPLQHLDRRRQGPAGRGRRRQRQPPVHEL